MTKFTHIFLLTLMLISETSVSSEYCNSMSNVSQDKIIRGLQSLLGLNSESALFRRCIREYSDRQNYRSLDLEYISSATLTDEFFRQNVAPKKILNSNEFTSELFRSQGQSLPQEDSDLISIDRLIKPGYESKGQLAD